MTTVAFVQAVLDWLLADPAHLVVLASSLAALIPTPKPDSIAGRLYRVIDIFALNILHAKETGMEPAASQPAQPQTLAK